MNLLILPFKLEAVTLPLRFPDALDLPKKVCRLTVISLEKLIKLEQDDLIANQLVILIVEMLDVVCYCVNLLETKDTEAC